MVTNRAGLPMARTTAMASCMSLVLTWSAIDRSPATQGMIDGVYMLRKTMHLSLMHALNLLQMLYVVLCNTARPTQLPF